MALVFFRHSRSGLASASRPAPQRRLLTGEAAERALFEGGPPTGLQTALGLMAPERPNILLRIVLAIAIGWLPLLVLTAAQSAMLSDGSLRAFLTDYAVTGRSLVAVPLLILAEKVCLPRLSGIAVHIRNTGLVRAADAEVFDRALKSTLRLRDSLRLEIAVVTIAAAILVTAYVTVPMNIFPFWYRLHGHGAVSPAGWWHALVSIPILIILLLGWVWRLILWTRFLWLVSRLPLRIVASHPDRAGGLKFIGMSVPAFSILAFAVGIIIAGTVTNRVVHDGASLLSFRYLVSGFDIICLILFVSPLLVFSGQLTEAWRRGSQEYGALAQRVGQEMESRWLNRDVDAQALAASDFSATTDLYSIAANVNAINVVPVSLRQMLMLAIGAVLPFVPIILVSVPPQVLWQKLSGLLF